MTDLAAPPAPARVLVATGAAAALVAAAATALAAALAGAAGVDLRVGGEPVPVPGVAVVTAVLSLAGVPLAIGLRRRSARPARVFVRTTVALTAVSLLPPLLADADAATVVTLVGLHLLAAGVVVPALARALPDVR